MLPPDLAKGLFRDSITTMCSTNSRCDQSFRIWKRLDLFQYYRI